MARKKSTRIRIGRQPRQKRMSGKKEKHTVNVYNFIDGKSIPSTVQRYPTQMQQIPQQQIPIYLQPTNPAPIIASHTRPVLAEPYQQSEEYRIPSLQEKEQRRNDMYRKLQEYEQQTFVPTNPFDLSSSSFFSGIEPQQKEQQEFKMPENPFIPKGKSQSPYQFTTGQMMTKKEYMDILKSENRKIDPDEVRAFISLGILSQSDFPQEIFKPTSSDVQYARESFGFF